MGNLLADELAHWCGFPPEDPGWVDVFDSLIDHLPAVCRPEFNALQVLGDFDTFNDALTQAKNEWTRACHKQAENYVFSNTYCDCSSCDPYPEDEDEDNKEDREPDPEYVPVLDVALSFDYRNPTYLYMSRDVVPNIVEWSQRKHDR